MANDTDFNFFDKQMCSGSWFCSLKGHGGPLVPILHWYWYGCWRTKAMGLEGLRQPHSSYTSWVFALALLSGFLGILFAMGSFPAVQSLSAAFNFQDASLMFVARRMKKSLESSSCHVGAVVDQIEGYLFHHSLCNFFTISWSWIGQ